MIDSTTYQVYLEGSFEGLSNPVEGQSNPIEGQFYPICAEGFKNNDIGAKKVCQALGFHSGSISSDVGTTSDKAIFVGECTPEGSLATDCMAAQEMFLSNVGCVTAQVTCSSPGECRLSF